MGKGGGRGERERENIIKEEKNSLQFKNWFEIVLPLLIKWKVHHQASEVKVVMGIFFFSLPFRSFFLCHMKKGSISWYHFQLCAFLWDICAEWVHASRHVLHPAHRIVKMINGHIKFDRHEVIVSSIWACVWLTGGWPWSFQQNLLY